MEEENNQEDKKSKDISEFVISVSVLVLIIVGTSFIFYNKGKDSTESDMVTVTREQYNVCVDESNARKALPQQYTDISVDLNTGLFFPVDPKTHVLNDTYDTKVLGMGLMQLNDKYNNLQIFVGCVFSSN